MVTDFIYPTTPHYRQGPSIESLAFAVKDLHPIEISLRTFPL